MGKKISISFKDTKRDNQLYDAVMELDDKSHDIKFILYQYFFGTTPNTISPVQKSGQAMLNPQSKPLPTVEDKIFDQLDQIEIDLDLTNL